MEYTSTLTPTLHMKETGSRESNKAKECLGFLMEDISKETLNKMRLQDREKENGRMDLCMLGTSQKEKWMEMESLQSLMESNTLESFV